MQSIESVYYIYRATSKLMAINVQKISTTVLQHINLVLWN